MSDYEVGYKKPPKHTQFGAGNNANPTGKTSIHRAAEIKAAEMAAMVQADLVEALYNTVKDASTDEARLEQLRGDVLKLLKDSQDRGFGAPQVHVDNTSSDRSMTPRGLAGFYAERPDSDGEGS